MKYAVKKNTNVFVNPPLRPVTASNFIFTVFYFEISGLNFMEETISVHTQQSQQYKAGMKH